MSDLNVEYVESIVKLGLIERKKSLLSEMGYTAASDDGELDKADWYLKQLRRFEHLESMIRDSKRTRSLAEAVVRASK